MAQQAMNRLNDKQYHSEIQRIENDIAVILDAKAAYKNLLLLMRSLQRRGLLDMVAVERDSVIAINDDLATISRALDIAHEALKRVRQVE